MVKVLMCGNHPSNKGGMTSVISQLRNHKWEEDDIQIKFIPTFYPGNPLAKIIYFVVSYLKIVASIILYKPDIMHMHMSYKGSFHRKFLIHKLCKCFGVKTVIHLHGGEFERWYNEANVKIQLKVQRLLKECDAFLVLGKKWKKVVENIEPTVNVIVVPNAVHIPRNTIKWCDKQFRILYMGVLIKKKGIDNLLQAIYGLKSAGKIESICLSIVGTGEEENRLKALCKEYGLENIVQFHGWINGKEKEKVIMDSQVAVLPSFYEGLPIFVFEALSYGLPVICTDVGGF